VSSASPMIMTTWASSSTTHYTDIGGLVRFTIQCGRTVRSSIQ
jgi:hypothetical protein